MPDKVEPEIRVESERRGQFVEIAKRLENVEKVVDVIEHLSARAADSWKHYLQEKATSDEKAQILDDRQNKRAVFIVCYSITSVGALCILALWKDQYELVKLILSSSLALAAGAGVTSVWKKSRKREE